MKQPESPEMARNQQLIQRIFSLVGPEGRITNGSVNTEHGMSHFRSNTGAKRAWDRLEKLRIRVWNHLGLLNKDTANLATSLSFFSPSPAAAISLVQPFDQPSSLAQDGLADTGIACSTTIAGTDVLLFDELQR